MNINWKYLSQSAAAFGLTLCGMLVELPSAMANSVTDSVPANGRIWVSIALWGAGYIVHHCAISTKIAGAPDPTTSTATVSVSTTGPTNPIAGSSTDKGPFSGGAYRGPNKQP